jgi:hypothetical protein
MGARPQFVNEGKKIMKSKITVVGSEFVTKHYDNNRKSESFVCKCIMHDADDEEGGADVGTVRIPLPLIPESVITGEGEKRRIRKGDYLIDFRAGRSYSDDGIVGRLCEFVPVPVVAKGQSVAAQPAQPAKQ